MSAHAPRVLAFAVVASLVATASCTGDSTSSGTSGASCPDDLPAACTSAPPTYAKDVAPVIQQSCTPCHAPGGQEASRSLVTYAGAFANRSSTLNQVHACRMPPAGAPPLPAEGRRVLQEWLVCGAPND